MTAQLLALAGHLMLLSVLAIGGTMAVAPDLRRVMVNEMGLITDTEFNASLALTQAAPGPNVLVMAALGYHAAGLVGAAVALLGMLVPSSTLAYAVSRWGRGRREWRVVRAFKTGMAPIVVALVFSTAWTVSHQAVSWHALVVAVAVALLAWRTRVHVIVWVAAGAAAGAMGWI